MGLIPNMFGEVLGRAIRVGAWALELAHEVADHPFQTPPGLEEETLMTDGPDDLWPADEYLAVSEPPAEPTLQVTQQWGLRLPNGEVHWNTWQGIVLDGPIDRMKMVATLQKTAADIGLAPGEQTEQFLARYQWVTRNQRATVIYEDTGVYPLADSYASALDAPEVNESSDGHDHQPPIYVTSSNGHRSDVGFRPGSVGGDAQ